MASNPLQEAVALAKAGKGEEALAVAGRLIDENADNVGAWLILAQLEVDPLRKINAWDNVVRLRPNDEKARQQLEVAQSAIPSVVPLPAVDIRPTKQCPYCAEVILEEAIVCRFCGRYLVPQTAEVIAPPKSERKKTRNGIVSFVVLMFFITVAILICSNSGNTSGSRTPPTPRPPDEIDACLMSQQFVKEQLRAPSTAEFPRCEDKYAVKLGENHFSVYAYVDSQNAFGAMLRTNYLAELRYVGGNKWSLIDLQFEDQ